MTSPGVSAGVLISKESFASDPTIDFDPLTSDKTDEAFRREEGDGDELRDDPACPVSEDGAKIKVKSPLDLISLGRNYLNANLVLRRTSL